MIALPEREADAERSREVVFVFAYVPLRGDGRCPSVCGPGHSGIYVIERRARDRSSIDFNAAASLGALVLPQRCHVLDDASVGGLGVWSIGTRFVILEFYPQSALIRIHHRPRRRRQDSWQNWDRRD